MSINCELDAAKEFREWQPTFLSTYSWAISFSKGCSGGAGGGGGGEVGGGAVMQVWVELEFFLRLLL